MFVVDISSDVLKELGELDEKIRNRVKLVFKILENDPVPAKILDVKKLRGFPNAYRIRIGRYRIVYDIDWEKKEVGIARISSRESAYG